MGVNGIDELAQLDRRSKRTPPRCPDGDGQTCRFRLLAQTHQ
jgi:hypothetical protein